MGGLDPCTLEGRVVQRVDNGCAFCEDWRALRLISKLVLLGIGLDIFIIERLSCVVGLSLIVREIVVAIGRRRSLIPLRRFIKLDWWFLRSRVEGIEAGRPNVLALPGFASGSLAAVHGRVRKKRLLLEEIEETVIVHTHFILFIYR